jgi:ribosomal protein L21
MYDIEHGLNKCLKIKKWQDDNMKIHQGEPVDIRHLSIIETDSDCFIGDVKISKRKISKKLVESLKKLKIFLAKSTSENIVKVLG